MEKLAGIPEQITSRYRIEDELGRGGFATVYRAWDEQVGRKVAIKLYHAAQGEELEKVSTEARILGSLSHPNIVTVFDANVADDHPYIVMAYLPGGSLREKLVPDRPPFRPKDALALTLVLAEALHYAHEMDVLHLDIKPENIIFDQRGRPYLTDFGIGRLMGGDEETKQTRAMGTNNYASPEQRQGGKLTRKSDIYSLGVVLFELLTNKLPLGPAAAHPQPPYSPPFLMNDPLTSAEGLVRLVCKALAVAPDYRYESADEFVQAIRDYMLHAGEDTGRLLPLKRNVDHHPVTRVHFLEPQRELRPSATRRIPQTVRQMEEDLTPVPPGTHVEDLLYSHQGVEVGVGSVVERAIFARGPVRLRQDALIKGDVISLTAIDIGPGAQAVSLIAPEVVVRGPVRLTGSIFCRRLRPFHGEDGVHLPDNSELGGSLIFGEQFERIVPDDRLGRSLKTERPGIEFYGKRPKVTIGSHCTLVAILGDVDVEVGDRQKQLNTIRVTGDVRLGIANSVRRIEGENVFIGRGCRVDEVHARGTLVIEQGSTVGYVSAGEGIELGDGCVIAAPMLFSHNGAIKEIGAASWSVGKRESELTAEHIFSSERDGVRGSIATILLDHRLYQLYDRIAPGWLPRLQPVSFEGAGEQVDLAPQLPSKSMVAESPPEYQSVDMDLIPASLRPEEWDDEEEGNDSDVTPPEAARAMPPPVDAMEAVPTRRMAPSPAEDDPPPAGAPTRRMGQPAAQEDPAPEQAPTRIIEDSPPPSFPLPEQAPTREMEQDEEKGRG